MTHELKKIIQAYEAAEKKGVKTILATVVALKGSSYRRPGVRMLIEENGRMVGAVSGGCVEKEILRQANTVFNTNIPRMMTYDGRYRLGCEGILYILIEPLQLSPSFIELFWNTVSKRQNFNISSHFSREDGENRLYGSVFNFGTNKIPLQAEFLRNESQEIFSQTMNPCFKLMIIGAEHDAVQLCSYAALTGWEVSIIASPLEAKNIDDFPGATEFNACVAKELNVEDIDIQTAVILMTHSYVKDLEFLIALKDVRPVYLGLLGPLVRREKLLNEFLEHCPEIPDHFFEAVHGPAGLNIGAESPQEIAIAIISEILSLVRKQEPMMLKNKEGRIHNV